MSSITCISITAGRHSFRRPQTHTKAQGNTSISPGKHWASSVPTRSSSCKMWWSLHNSLGLFWNTIKLHQISLLTCFQRIRIRWAPPTAPSSGRISIRNRHIKRRARKFRLSTPLRKTPWKSRCSKWSTASMTSCWTQAWQIRSPSDASIRILRVFKVQSMKLQRSCHTSVPVPSSWHHRGPPRTYSCHWSTVQAIWETPISSQYTRKQICRLVLMRVMMRWVRK